MLQAAACAQYDEPAPQDLIDSWDCQKYNVPFDGISLMDQPAGKVRRMNTASNVHDAFDSRQRAIQTDMPLNEWADNNPRAWKIVAHIERIRFDNSS